MVSRGSRNDQVVTDMRMWLRDELKKIEKYLKDFLKVCVARAEQDISLLMPGFVTNRTPNHLPNTDVRIAILISRRRNPFVGASGCSRMPWLLRMT